MSVSGGAVSGSGSGEVVGAAAHDGREPLSRGGRDVAQGRDGGRVQGSRRRGVRGGAVPEHALSPLAGDEGGGVSCPLRRQDGGAPYGRAAINCD